MAKEAFKTIHGNEFGTPQWLYDSLNKEFQFTHDLACAAYNQKAPEGLRFEETDSLEVDWHKLSTGWLWLNPPYSPLKPWIQKAQKENELGARIVILCPPIISTRYFKKRLPSEIRFILGRVPFVLNGEEMKSNTNDSCLLIYDTEIRQPLINYVERDKLKCGPAY